ncbi:hypothetical protein [Phenylobacterium sp.]|uniref:hypothetical protein n=1 Tax=Phenylobacterium sp. TaxID=1871053 RepID=UPI00286CBA54|nr:hypothetical protein [Phenylobacterium sp.]
MPRIRVTSAALALLGLLAAAPVLAQEAPQATAPVGVGAVPNIADQIDTYLKTSPAVLPRPDTLGVTTGTEPRTVHGVVDVAVGTGGYRSAYLRADLPIGASSTLSVAVRETRSDGRFGPRQQQDLGLSLAFGEGDGLDPADPRCRPALDPTFGGQVDPRRGEVERLRSCRFAGARGPSR